MIKVVQNSIGLISRLLCNFLVLIVIGFFYGADSLGEYSLAMAWGLLLVLLVEYGFHLKFPVDLEKAETDAKKHTVLSQSLFCKNIFSLVMFLIYGFIYYQNLYPGDKDIVTICFLLCLINSYVNFFLIYIRVCNGYLIESFYITISSVLFLFSIVICSYFISDIYYSLLLALFVRVGVFLYISKFEFKSFFCFINCEPGIQQFKHGVPFFILTMVGVLYVNIDTILMGYVLSKENLALYQVIIQVLLASSVIAFAVSQVTLQNFSQINSGISFSNLNKYVISMSFFGLIISLFVAIFFELFLKLLFPYLHEFYEFDMLVYLAVLIALRYAISPIGSFLTATGNNDKRLYSTTLAIITSVLYLTYNREHLTILIGLKSNVISHSIMFVAMYFFSHLNFKNEFKKN
jgi:O-antigen/teichoic acid export membrane protein